LVYISRHAARTLAANLHLILKHGIGDNMSLVNESKLALGLVLALTIGLTHAEVKYEEGIHYVLLPVPQEIEAPGKIEVMEYFSYACIHCFRFEPIVLAWRQGLLDDVTFNRTPALWNNDLETYGKSYYAAEALGVLEKVHIHLFNLIQQKKPKDPQVIALSLTNVGVDPIDFARMLGSFEVDRRLGKARGRGQAYEKAYYSAFEEGAGVPMMVVNGKYLISGATAGGNAAMLPVAEHLIQLERQAMAAKAD
jgi:thiol:disulfide interchange protein DsbA